jgi:hypothetical protein
MAKATTASKAAEHVPKKRAHEGDSDRGAPKKGRSAKYRKWCNTADGPFTNHNTFECCMFAKDGSPMDKPTKPFDPARKTWKETGSEDSCQMAYLTEEMTKLKKKLKKSKKHICARDSSDTDSDDDNGSSSTGNPVDKRLKLKQPTGVDLKSTDTRPIKATKLALNTIRANEIAIEKSKTGKVTAVVTILKVFGDIICNSRNANPEKLLSKPNKRLNSKKKRLNIPLKCHNRLSESVSDTSKRLLVKQKLKGYGSTQDRVMTPFSSKKGLKNTYQHEEGCTTVVGHFKWHL